MADLIGQQLGHYRLVRLIGRGGFADVYQGVHIYLNRPVAVKVLHVHLVQQEFPGFLQEAQMIAHLTHPNIIQILDFGIEGTPFLVMEYLPFGSLRERYPSGTRIPLSTIVSYVKQIADALQHAHDSKVIHRDIKPANVLLRSSDQIILSDFGIATVAHRTSSMQTQNISGSPAYMAPEQISGKPRPASDQYALGMMVYEWLCGKPAFQGEPLALMFQQTYNPIPSLRQQVPSIVPEIEGVIMTALAKDPQQRFVNIQTFYKALEQASKPVQTKVVTSKKDTRIPSKPQFLRLDVAQRTDVGRQLEHNEDNMGYIIPKDQPVMAIKGALFIVADGMNEHAAGEVASEIAVDTVCNVYYTDDSDDAATSLLDAIKRANALIHQRAAENMPRSGMGTTCVSAVLRGNMAYIANVGDSRAYLVRKGQIRQISQDHSWVAEQVRTGLLTEDQGRTHPGLNILTRYLGSEADVDIDLFPELMKEGDAFVLCTDGLSKLVSDDEIRSIVDQYDPQESVYKLVMRANENGGRDNITAIVIRVQRLG